MKLSSSTEWLFFHLWKKNPENNNQSCPGVFIPDTIIYRWAKPFFWYFTTRDGQILRKTKERVYVEHFEEIFQQNNASAGLISMSLTSSEVQEPDGGIREKIEFEYFDKHGFKDFVYQRDKTFGILQKFLEPKGHKNSLIKVSWSPQFCLLSRKTNIYDLNNNRHPLLDRVITYEGSEYLTTSDSISSPILSSDIEQLCINIVKHVQDVSGGNIQISRMVLYFKLDHKNRLWLLFCTGIKVREKYVGTDFNEPLLKQPTLQDERVLSPLLRLNQRKTVDTGTTNILKKVNMTEEHYLHQMKYVNDNVCANCEAQCSLYDVQFTHIIQSFESNIFDEESKLIQKKIKEIEEEEKNPILMKEKQRKKEQEKEKLFYNIDEEEEDYYNKNYRNIPGIILKVWGKISEEKYKQLKSNQSWLQLTTKVCDSCFVKLTQIVLDSRIERETKNAQVVLKNSKKEDIDMLFQLKSPEQMKKKKINEEKQIVQHAQQQQQSSGNQQQFLSTSKQNTPVASPSHSLFKKHPHQIGPSKFEAAVNVNNNHQADEKTEYFNKQPNQQNKPKTTVKKQDQQQQQTSEYFTEIQSQQQQQQQGKETKKQVSGLNLKQKRFGSGHDFQHINADSFNQDQLNTDRGYSMEQKRVKSNGSLYSKDMQLLQPLTSRGESTSRLQQFQSVKSKQKKFKSFDPSKIYKNKQNLHIKLPSITNTSIQSNTTLNSINNHSSSRGNNVNFMLSTIQDLKNILNSDFNNNSVIDQSQQSEQSKI